jgi:hypothetical protein
MDIHKLSQSITWSNQKLEKARKERLKVIKQFVGAHYADKGADKKVPVNLLEMAVSIYLRLLAARAPKCIVGTDNPALRPFAADMEIVLNQLPKEIDLRSTLRRAVVEAMFSMGVVKVGIGGTNDNRNIGDEPFVSVVQLDDYFCDMSARSWGEVQYEGNDYWLSTEEVKKLYGKDLAYEDYNGTGVDGQEQANSITNSESGEVLFPRVRLRDVYIYATNRLITYAPATNTVLRDVHWDGPEGSPYLRLCFSEVPGNLLPLPPVAVWQDLHDLSNSLFRKLSHQATSHKRVAAFQGGNDEDITRLKVATDGEGIRYNGGKPEVIEMGGVNQPTLAFALTIRDLFNAIAGNLDALGGLSAQADTASQEKLVSEAASARLKDMGDCVVEFTKAIFRRLAWYVWTDPVRERKYVKVFDAKHGIALDKVWTPDTRDGDFLDYNFDIDVFSMQDDGPATRIQKMMTFFERLVMPMQPMMEAQGLAIDMKAVVDYVARNSNMPELADMIVALDGSQDMGRMPSGGSPHPQYVSTKAPVTRRIYERTNRPGATRHGRDAAMMQTLLGGGAQPSEMAALSPNRTTT